MMAGPPPQLHQGHTAPAELPALPQAGGAAAGAQTQPWHRCPQQDRAVPSQGHGGVDAALSPRAR